LGDYYASAVTVAGKAYIASEQGVVVVFDATEDTLNVLARNNLAEAILATPAIVDGKIYLRTATSLYAFGF
jgi:outer membrane protein assembly factor BamB